MAAIFQNGYQNYDQNPEAGIFPFFPNVFGHALHKILFL